MFSNTLEIFYKLPNRYAFSLSLQNFPLQDIFKILSSSDFYSRLCHNITTPVDVIGYLVGDIFQFIQSPRSLHLDVARRILHFLKGPLAHGLMYKKGNNFLLKGFTYANWASDAICCRSTSSY